ncbi:MAG TPA: hypothetical protein VES42_02015 [Pilimelia sp.]|nr:hypothetical protein [Pilimelia sp.]
MSTALPVALMALAGVLVGGAWSSHRQGSPRATVAVFGVLAALALVGGILWLIPGDT